MDTTATECCDVDGVSGNLVTCSDNEFKRFHYGASISSAGTSGTEWGGIDMRAEVAVLTRFITIRAETRYMLIPGYTGHDEEGDPWGCRVLVSDWWDTGAGLAQRKGKVHMDYVEIRGCG
jgi:hypothetical protein